MSLQIPVQKDIGEYTEKIVGKMSLRTLACTSGGFAAAVGAACAAFFGLGIPVSDATLPVMACALPFWLAGYWRPYGMTLERFAPLLFAHHARAQRLLYASSCTLTPTGQAGPVPGKPGRRARRQAKRKGAELYEPSKGSL